MRQRLAACGFLVFIEVIATRSLTGCSRIPVWQEDDIGSLDHDINTIYTAALSSRFFVGKKTPSEAFHLLVGLVVVLQRNRFLEYEVTKGSYTRPVRTARTYGSCVPALRSNTAKISSFAISNGQQSVSFGYEKVSMENKMLNGMPLSVANKI